MLKKFPSACFWPSELKKGVVKLIWHPIFLVCTKPHQTGVKLYFAAPAFFSFLSRGILFEACIIKIWTKISTFCLVRWVLGLRVHKAYTSSVLCWGGSCQAVSQILLQNNYSAFVNVTVNFKNPGYLSSQPAFIEVSVEVNSILQKMLRAEPLDLSSGTLASNHLLLPPNPLFKQLFCKPSLVYTNCTFRQRYHKSNFHPTPFELKNLPAVDLFSCLSPHSMILQTIHLLNFLYQLTSWYLCGQSLAWKNMGLEEETNTQGMSVSNARDQWWKILYRSLYELGKLFTLHHCTVKCLSDLNKLCCKNWKNLSHYGTVRNLCNV